MTIAPLLLALLLATGALGATEQLFTERLLPARAALADELPDIAIARLERIINTNEFKGSEDAAKLPVLVLLGEALVRDQQFQEAESILGLLPADSVARNYWLGLAEAKLGKSQNALLTLAQVPVADPTFGQVAHYNRLEILTDTGDTAGALALLTELRTINPDFRPQELALAEALLYLRRNEPSLAKKALARLKPEDFRALTIAGRIELMANNPEKALTLFQESLASEPTPPLQILSWLGKADANLAMDRPFDALQNILSLLALAPGDEILELLIPRFDALNRATSQPDSQERIRAELETFTADPARTDLHSKAIQFLKFQKANLLPLKDSHAELRQLLESLLVVGDNDSLIARIHFALANSLFQEGRPEETRTELEQLLQHSPNSPLAPLAADLLARLAAQEGSLPEARELFAQAAQSSNAAFAEAALLNQAIIALQVSGQADLSAISEQLSSDESRTSLRLQKILSAAQAGEDGAELSLEDFLSQNPAHPRIGEAKLSLVHILLKANRPDFARITSALEDIPNGLAPEQSLERFNLSHQLGALGNQWELAVRFGERHLKRHSTAASDPYFLLRLGESRFRNGDYDRSRLLFSEITKLENASGLEDVALYFIARANLAIPTDTATREALDTLDELSKRSGPLSTQARILKARTLLENLGKPEECLADLALLPGELSDRTDVALLAAEAYRELGTSDPPQYEAALKLYRELLANPNTSYARSNQLHYLIARTYRESGRPGLALDPCLAVIDFQNRESPDTPPEWDFYYRCGFEAIDLLLEAKRYRAALLLANKLAKTDGPGATQAKERAEQIQLDHTLFAE